MAAAAQLYVTWMTTTAGQAEHAAMQAQSAAAAGGRVCPGGSADDRGQPCRAT
jgi:PPE-repeat protein